VLRKTFEWTDECQQVFEGLKAYLASTLLLCPSKPGEELYLYLAVSPHAISSASIRKDRKVQKPVYYTSKALREQKNDIHPWKNLHFLWRQQQGSSGIIFKLM